MKYSSSNKPLQCMMMQSTCYKGTTQMTVKGVLWHSTGANNPNLKRYVQPDDNAADRATLLAKLGTNTNKNDWNHVSVQAGLNCWIGKLADGTVTTVQTMPWNYKPWGCGSGSKGSCNDGWIQFEICEDGLSDAAYFGAVYAEACELTAYLCKLYNIDPNGTVDYNGVTVPTILCHADSHSYGLGSNHGDVNHWFPKFGKSMATARADVAALLKADGSSVTQPTTPVQPTTPTTSELVAGAKLVLNGVALYASATTATKAGTKTGTYYLWGTDVVSNRVRITNSTANVGKSGQVTGWIDVSDAQKAVSKSTSASTPTVFVPYTVKVTVSSLNIRSGAGTGYVITGKITDKGVYTIVAESAGTGASLWGKLKSGAGWISLDYCTKT